MGQYQTLEGKVGSSRTDDKFRALNLPPDFFQGKSVLDLGCNEGAFSAKALELGATRAVGVEGNVEFANRARANFPNITVLNQSWSEPIDGTFDVVLFLSAIHYDDDKLARLQAIWRQMTDGGTLVLECGVAGGENEIEVETVRKVGTVRHPTRPLWLKWIRKSGFSIVYEGKSVDQQGDPIPRFVFHCKKLTKTAILVAADAGSGKSTLARTLGCPAWSLDHLIFGLDQEHKRSRSDSAAVSIPKILAAFSEGGLETMLTKKIKESLSRVSEPVLVVEGYAMTEPWVLSAIVDAFSDDGWRLWFTQPMPTRAIESSEQSLLEIDKNPTVRVAHPRWFEWRSQGSSFILHPPSERGSESSIEWFIGDRVPRELVCEVSLPFGAQPVTATLVAIDAAGQGSIVSTIEVSEGKKVVWRTRLPDLKVKRLRICSCRSSASESNSRSWLIVHKPVIR